MAGSGAGCLLSEPRLKRFGGGDVVKVIAKGRANELTAMFVLIVVFEPSSSHSKLMSPSGQTMVSWLKKRGPEPPELSSCHDFGR